MKGDTEVLAMIAFALVGFLLGTMLALDHLPSWIGTIGTVLTIGLAAISAWRSEKAAQASQASAAKSYELELTRSYPFLRLENQTVGSAFFPDDHKMAHLKQSGHVLVVFLTLRNIGGTSAVVDWLELEHVGSGRSMGTSLSRFEGHTMPNRALHYIPGPFVDPVTIEPGHSKTVGAWFIDAPQDRDYRITTKGDSFPAVSMSFRPLAAGGTTIQGQSRRRPAELLREWIDAQ